MPPRRCLLDVFEWPGVRAGVARNRGGLPGQRPRGSCHRRVINLLSRRALVISTGVNPRLTRGGWNSERIRRFIAGAIGIVRRDYAEDNEN